MTTNYFTKARWLQGAASANESKKMQVNPRITPFRFACTLLLLLTLSIGNAWGDSKEWDFSTDGLSSKSPITLTYGQGGASNNTAVTSGTVRLYAKRSNGNGSWIKFEAASGYEITGVSVTATNNQSYARYGVDPANTNAALATSFSYTNGTATVTSLHATSFAIKNGQSSGSSNKTVYFSNITITYASTASCTSITPSLSYASVGGTTLVVGSSSSGSPTVSGNTGSGTVTYSVTAASPAGCATVNSSTGVVTAVAAGTATITASIAANGGYCSGSATASFTITNPTYTVGWQANGTDWTGAGHGTPSTSVVSGNKVTTLPTAPTSAACDGSKVFVGWTATHNYSNASTPPSDLFTTAAGAPAVTANVTYYAVFANQTAFNRVTSTSDLGANKAIVVVDDQNSKVLTTTPSYATAPTEDGTTHQIEPDISQIWVLEASSSNWKLKTGSAYLGTTGTSNGTAVSLTSTNSTWTIGASSSGTNNFYLLNTGAANLCLEYYSSSPSWVVYANKSYSSSTYFTERLYVASRTNYATTCCTSLGSINGSVKVISGTGMTLQWDDISNVSSWAVTGVDVTNSNAAVPAGNIGTPTDKGSTYECAISSLTAGHQYKFTIAATAASGYCDKTQDVTATTPLITLSETGLSGMSYIETYGPSTQTKTFTVTAVGLTGNLTVTAPTNFEVSTDNSTWGSSKTITHTSGSASGTVYVRLAAGLSEGSYGSASTYVTVSGGSATTKNVSVQGTVSPACSNPTINTQPASSASYNLNETATALSVTATKNGTGAALTYQWYSNTANSKTTPTPATIGGATSSSYTPPTTATGTKYYFCEVSSGACAVTTNISTITVNTPSITASETARAFGDRKVNGGPYEMTLTVSGANLAKDQGIGLAITGTNAGMFAIKNSVTSIAQTSAGTVSTTTVTVQYSPTAAGSHSATLTFSSTSATNKTVALTGTGKWEVIWSVNGVETSSLVANSTKPTLPSPNPSSCDATSTTFIGWTKTAWTGKQNQAYVDGLTTDATKVHTSNSTMTNITANGTKYYAVFAKGTSGSTTYTASYGFETGDAGWTAQNINQYSTYKSSGSYSGKCADNGSGTIKTPNTLKFNTKLSSPVSISFKSSKSTTNTNTGNYWSIQYSANGSDWSNLASSSGPNHSALTQGTFSDATEVDLSDLSNVYIRINHNGTSPATLLDDIVLSYTASGTTYSDYLTTCCSNKVALTKGSLSHCDIAFDNANPQTCSATDADRQVTVTVTPSTGYGMSGSDRLTFTKSSGTATATYVSGPTGSGPYTFVYRFDQNDNGAGTFGASCSAQSYTVTFDKQSGTGGSDNVSATYAAAMPSAIMPTRVGYTFGGYWTEQNGGGTQYYNADGTSARTWNIASATTLYAKWTARALTNHRTECGLDISVEGDVWLTSYAGVDVFTTEESANLITVDCDDFGSATRLGVAYLLDGSPVTYTSSPFRLCWYNFTGKTDYNLVDSDGSAGSASPYRYYPLTSSEKTALGSSQTFAIRYNPGAAVYNQEHTYTLRIAALDGSGNDLGHADLEIHGRALPQKFVIAAKINGQWKALPADLKTSSGNAAPAPYLIGVDNTGVPTTAVAPKNAIYSGYTRNNGAKHRGGIRLHTETGTSDGYVQAARSNSSSSIWRTTSSCSTGMQEWYLKSTDFGKYTIGVDPVIYVSSGSGEGDDGEGNTGTLLTRKLSVYSGTIGWYTTAADTFRILPVTEFEPVDLQVVEWKSDKVVFMYLGNPNYEAEVEIGGVRKASTAELSTLRVDKGVYEIAVSDLATSANQAMYIIIKNSGVEVGRKQVNVPIMVSSAVTRATATSGFTKDPCANIDLVILPGGKLTVSDATVYSFKTITVYGGGKLVVDASRGITAVDGMYLRAGTVTSGTYQYTYPQIHLGSGATLTVPDNIINFDYLTTKNQYYALALPRPVTINNTNIFYPADIYGSYKNGSYLMDAFNSSTRAEKGAVDDVWEDKEDVATTRGLGYYFLGMPRKMSINGAVAERQTYGIQRLKMNVTSAAALATGENADFTTSSLTYYSSDQLYNAGWNYLGNPFFADLTTGETDAVTADDDVVVQLVFEAGEWKTQKAVRYITVPNDDASATYDQRRVKDYNFPAFKTFYIQIGKSGTITFSYARRSASAPARYLATGKPEEIEYAIALNPSEGRGDTTHLLVGQAFGDEYEIGDDLHKMPNNGVQLFSVMNGVDLFANAINTTRAQQGVAVGYTAPEDGTYTFSKADKETDPWIKHLWLIDYEKGTLTDLLSDTYEFHTPAGTDRARFVLNAEFMTEEEMEVTTGTEELGTDETISLPEKFIRDERLIILRNGQLYDALGRKVINK